MGREGITRVVMLYSTCIEERYEAAAGDLDDQDWAPVFISRRDTGEDVITLKIREEGHLLVGTYEILDPELDRDDVVVLFAQTFLRTHANDWYRDKVDEIVLDPADGATRGAEFAYPRFLPT